MALRRRFTDREAARMVVLAAQIGDTIDAELGRLLACLALGSDEVLPQIHDRLNVLGRFEGADRLRKIIEA